MKPTLLILLLGLVLGLAACGNPASATSDQTIRTYADTVQAGDLTAARTLIRNPSIDWKETTARVIDAGVVSYTVRDLVENELGYAATIVWQTADAPRPFCSYVRVRSDTGVLEMVNDGTFRCPVTSTAPAP